MVWVGTLGAVFGPLLTPWERRVGEAIGLDQFIGPFLFAAVFFAISGTVVAVWLRPDPLSPNGQLDPNAQRVRPLRQVRNAAGVVAHAARWHRWVWWRWWCRRRRWWR